LKTNGSSIWNMIKTLVREVPSRVKGYVKENWGAPFVLGFMALLMVAAVSLLMGLVVLANEVAVYAYYALVVGFVLQLVCFLKYGKRNDEPKQ
jgi:heme/copper-type cytochrome/quinol oxidase subunit 4